MIESIKINRLTVEDLRFPTSLEHDGSDAMHTDPDYSCAYVMLHTDSGLTGFGLAFTLGKGTQVVVEAIKALEPLIIGRSTDDIFGDFASSWKLLTSDSQIRWLGPDKGVMHMAAGSIVSALWDLWAKMESKPLWKLLTDMSPKQLVSTIDFTYIEDVITKAEAVEILEKNSKTKNEMEKKLIETGYPAYTTQVGWLGYSDEKLENLCKKYMAEGFTAFKIKVGQNLEDDKRRCRIARETIGQNNHLMVDANQIWSVPEAIQWMKGLTKFNLLWIEEPTSPDDILGHATIAKELEAFGIGVASGEMCANKVMFKQMLQTKALAYCQIDACRLAGPNEILAVYLMAHKLNVPVCPHAGGVGLCEMVQHLQMWDYCCLSKTSESRWIEYVDQQHEHFVNPVRVTRACYTAPKAPGYSTEITADTIGKHRYPSGSVWQELFAKGLYKEQTSVID